MAKRRTPEERQADAKKAEDKARRDGLQARLDSYAALADQRGWPRRLAASIRHLLAIGEIFDWSTDDIAKRVDAVELMFSPEVLEG